ncbi:hypothetical protein ACIRF8_15755 [Streptomyces sp. NPDC102406]|uniref:DUF7848 domain-containing protein n=1 Tax=Streptomyces sp. NPDC102406 TaxID=3366171 RepID=UPI00382E3B8D
MTRSVIKPADWIIGPERDADGHLIAPQRAIRCTLCDSQSEVSARQGDVDRWAMKHTGSTGHREYEELTTAKLRVSPAPTNPVSNPHA